MRHAAAQAWRAGQAGPVTPHRGSTTDQMLLSVNSRILVNQAGAPVFFLGEAGWSAIAQLTNAQIDTYLNDRASRGFNLVLVNLVEHHFATNAPSNIDGVAPFTGTNWITPNNTYFQRADYFVAKAASLGIYLLLDVLYLGFNTTDEGWNDEVGAASTGDMTSWGQYVAGRYGAYNNIIWVVNGDRDPTAYLSKVTACANGILSVDTRHLITSHNEPASIGSDHVSGEGWLTFNNVYAVAANVTGVAVEAYDYTPVLPYIHIEGHYENENSITTQGLRAQAYWAALAGAVGHVFGNSPIWKFAYTGVTADWVNALDDAGSLSMTQYAALFRSLAWSTLVPDFSHAWLTVGYGTLGNANYCGAAKNVAGTLGVIYMPSNRTMTVVMSGFAGSVTARWYDPTNGSYTADAGSPVANSGTHDFSRASANNAGDNDWVLILTA